MTSAFKRLIPTLNRILVKKFEVETKTKSGIILQEAAEQTAYGEVIAVGNGSFDNSGKLVPLTVTKGDLVVLPDYGGTQINLKDGEFLIYRDSDIVGILKKD